MHSLAGVAMRPSRRPVSPGIPETGRTGRRSGASPVPPPLGEEGDSKGCFLLFSGCHRVPRGGLADLVGTYTSEATAREAFRRVRLRDSSESSWAQLAVVESNDGIRAISWFGIGATPSRTPVTPAATEEPPQAPPAGSASAPGPGDHQFAPRRSLVKTAVWLQSAWRR